MRTKAGGSDILSSSPWGEHVVRWGSASSSDEYSRGEGILASIPVFVVSDPRGDSLLGREISWMILDAFSALNTAHPEGASPQEVHDLWRDIARGVARRVAEATIVAGGSVIDGLEDVPFSGLLATHIDGEPSWIAVSAGEMDILEVDSIGRVRPIPREDTLGADLPGDLWTFPMKAGQRFVVGTASMIERLADSRHAALTQLRRAERAASSLMARVGDRSADDHALVVVDVVTPEDDRALASPPTLAGVIEESVPVPDSELGSAYGLEALGVDDAAKRLRSRRSHAAPPVIDDFHFVSYLGSGGFSDVYLYEEQLPKRLVAIKVLSPRAGTARFRVEVDLMAQLSGHPSVVSIHDADIAPSGQPYIVMQYCPMPSLAERLAGGPLGLSEALKMAVQISGAVHTAHAMGIVHHDLKPANVLFSEFGRPLLGDFGIAGLVGRDGGEALGVSLPWAAPEVLLGEQAGTAADVYSLAATLYTAVAGNAPYPLPAMSRREFITTVLDTDPEPLSIGADAGVATRVREVVERAMANEPTARFESAAEFGLALQDIQIAMGEQPTDLEIPQP